MNPTTVLWVYIVLLVAGGLVGFLKAGSFAAALILCAIGVISPPRAADILLAVLLVFFALRLTKTKKFMPNGLMLALTVAALALRHLRF